MKRHFEDTWNESEKAIKPAISTDNRAFQIKEALDSLVEELRYDLPEDADEEDAKERQELIHGAFGEVLHQLTGISKDHNINSDYALRLAVENSKIDSYG